MAGVRKAGKLRSRQGDQTHLVAVTRALSEFSAIAKVETLGTANGKVRLRALPSPSAPVPSELASLIRTRLIEAEEVHVERGNLDDVFRQITTSDAGTSHA